MLMETINMVDGKNNLHHLGCPKGLVKGKTQTLGASYHIDLLYQDCFL